MKKFVRTLGIAIVMCYSFLFVSCDKDEEDSKLITNEEFLENVVKCDGSYEAKNPYANANLGISFTFLKDNRLQVYAFSQEETLYILKVIKTDDNSYELTISNTASGEQQKKMNIKVSNDKNELNVLTWEGMNSQSLVLTLTFIYQEQKSVTNQNSSNGNNLNTKFSTNVTKYDDYDEDDEDDDYDDYDDYDD